MENMTKTINIPVINQVFRDVAIQHLAECGLPESLIDGVDCSTFEAMEESLAKVKNCFYSSIYKHIEETYGVKGERTEKLIQRMEYEEKDYWKMFREMDFTTEENKYIANLYHVMCEAAQLGTETKSGNRVKRLLKKESLLTQVIKSGIEVGIEAGIKEGIDENLMNKFEDFVNLEWDIRGEIEREGFICGFRTAYHLLEECRA